jgi:hypothetical protein
MGYPCRALSALARPRDRARPAVRADEARGRRPTRSEGGAFASREMTPLFRRVRVRNISLVERCVTSDGPKRLRQAKVAAGTLTGGSDETILEPRLGVADGARALTRASRQSSLPGLARVTHIRRTGTPRGRCSGPRVLGWSVVHGFGVLGGWGSGIRDAQSVSLCRSPDLCRQQHLCPMTTLPAPTSTTPSSMTSYPSSRRAAPSNNKRFMWPTVSGQRVRRRWRRA